VDVFDAKADVMAVLALAGAPMIGCNHWLKARPGIIPAWVGSLTLGSKNRLATFG
jgi:hypothetical protein